MWPAKVVMAAHFFQSADGALKFELELLSCVEFRGYGLCADDKFNVAVVEFIDHINEAPCLVINGFVHYRDVGNE